MIEGKELEFYMKKLQKKMDIGSVSASLLRRSKIFICWILLFFLLKFGWIQKKTVDLFYYQLFKYNYVVLKSYCSCVVKVGALFSSVCSIKIILFLRMCRQMRAVRYAHDK
jgi:hypothetical protein